MSSSNERQEEEEASVSWGLGYHHGKVVRDDDDDDDGLTNHSSKSVDAMMKQYMRQCLEFHHEQEVKRSRQEANESTLQQIQHQQQQQLTPHFVHGTSQQPQSNKVVGTQHDDPNTAQPEKKDYDDEPLDEDSSNNSNNNKKQSHTQEQIEAARARAQAILERFQQQQEKFLFKPSSESTADICSQYTATDAPPGFFVQQRQHALQREQERKDAFWEKNCRYAIAREQDRLAQQAQQLQQTTAWHEQYQAALQERQKTRYEQRKLARSKAAAVEQSKEGIGMAARPKLDQKQQQQHLRSQTGQTVAVYVSGFPTDGSINEEYIKALFGSYGAIRKVHFYRNKATGQLKGDALVIYEQSVHEREDDSAELLKNVCQQVCILVLCCPLLIATIMPVVWTGLSDI